MSIQLTPENFSTENFQKFLNNFSLDEHGEALEAFKNNTKFKTQVSEELGQTFVSMLIISELLEIDLEETIQKAINTMAGEGDDKECCNDDDCDEDNCCEEECEECEDSECTDC